MGFHKRHCTHMILTHSHKNEGLFSRNSSSTLKSPEGSVPPGQKATLASTAPDFPSFGHSHAFIISYFIPFLYVNQSLCNKPCYHHVLNRKGVLFLEQNFTNKYTENKVILVLSDLGCGVKDSKAERPLSSVFSSPLFSPVFFPCLLSPPPSPPPFNSSNSVSLSCPTGQTTVEVLKLE